MLTRYWQQLDLFEVYEWKCSKDDACYRAIVEKKRVFKFFMGLNSQLDDVRDRILSTKPLPNLRAAFSEVRHEENMRKLMLGPSLTAPMVEGSALSIHRPTSSAQLPPDVNSQSAGSNLQYPASSNSMRNGRSCCEKCKRPNHKLETCWRIHGKPSNWKPARERRSHSATTKGSTPEQQPFSKEQLEMLHKLLSQAHPNNNSSILAPAV